MSDQIKVSLLERRGVYYMQYRDPITGNKVRKSTGIKIPESGKAKIKKALSEAERLAGEWETKARAGKDWRSGQMAWEEFRDQYETQKLEGLRPATQNRYSNVLNHVERVIGPRKLRDVANNQTLSKYQAERRTEGAEPATIKTELTHIRATVRWAHSQGWIDKVPAIPKVQSKSRKTMKGRPLHGEEFERMLMAVEKVIVEPNKGKASKRVDREPDHDRIPSWRFLLQGLYWSGLRLGEAMNLHWSDRRQICVDWSGKYPVLAIPGDKQKNGQDQDLAIAPEFVELLMAVPKKDRHGYVFDPQPQNEDKGRLNLQTVMNTIAAIGEAAGIKTDTRKKENAKGEVEVVPTFASAHDLRRSFGTRWASRIMPNELKTIMRHSSISTTMKYYVAQETEKTASILWDAVGKKKGPLGANLGATEPERVKK